MPVPVFFLAPFPCGPALITVVSLMATLPRVALNTASLFDWSVLQTGMLTLLRYTYGFRQYCACLLLSGVHFQPDLAPSQLPT